MELGNEDWVALRDGWKACYLAISKKQSYSIAGRTLTYANLSEVQQQLAFCEAMVKRTSGGKRGIRIRNGVSA